MKRIAIVLPVFAVALLSTGAALAFDIRDIPGVEVPEVPRVPIPNVPTTAEPVGGMVGSAVLETTLNAKISHAKCEFREDTSETTCDLRSLGRELAVASTTGAHTGHPVVIVITAGPAEGIEGKKEKKRSAEERADAIREGLEAGFSGFASPPSCETRTSGKANRLSIMARVE